MFTPSEREAIRTAILNKAKVDPRLSGGAITGSASVGHEDEWSDIDLAFGVRTGTSLEEVLADFTAFMEAYGVADWFDVPSGAWIYRVHLLESTLQVDLAFVRESEFGARAPTFRLEFGDAVVLPPPAAPQKEDLIGYAWLYALHARSSLTRGKLWQAEYFVSALRNQVLALACIRHGLPHRDGRGFDRLPPGVLNPLRGSFAGRLEAEAIHPAFQSVTRAFLIEAGHADAGLARRLQTPLREMAQWPPTLLTND